MNTFFLGGESTFDDAEQSSTVANSSVEARRNFEPERWQCVKIKNI